MKKLTLNLDEVAVESFPTSTIPGEQSGTVKGAATGNCNPSVEEGNCTLDIGCSGGGKCSWNQDCSVEFCSDVCTYYPNCSNDGNCSLLERCTGLTVCYWTP